MSCSSSQTSGSGGGSSPPKPPSSPIDRVVWSDFYCSRHGAHHAPGVKTMFRCVACLMEENYEECSECGYWNPRRDGDPWPCQWPRCTRNRYMCGRFGPTVSGMIDSVLFDSLRAYWVAARETFPLACYPCG